MYVFLEDFAARPHTSGASATQAGQAIFKGLKTPKNHPKSTKNRHFYKQNTLQAQGNSAQQAIKFVVKKKLTLRDYKPSQ
jgi:hypothetical protein